MLLNYRRERNLYIQQSSIHKPSTLPLFNMLSLQYCVFSLLFLYILTGVSCEELTPVKNEEHSLEGSTVTLSYRYSKQATGGDNFFWYRQYPGKPPEFIMFISGINITRPAESLKSDTTFFTELTEEKRRVNLQISSAAVTDSAVYYCAVTSLGNSKFIFGSGTKLRVESNEESTPSYYKLPTAIPSDDGKTNISVCLATGFSRYSATGFSKTEAVLIKDDTLYNQVALMPPTEKCDEAASGDSPTCDDKLEPDAKVNLMTLTIMGLRLLFFKTIVFNVLMTLRLWISQ